jgi:regulator of PEP synthase PpsR (kinase-PPPase family)
MSEVQGNEIPIPLVNYVELIRNHRSPYYDVVFHLLKEMEMHYKTTGERSEVVYTINPRILQEEIEEKIKDDRLTTVNICRSILALLYGSKLSEEKDYYVTTTSGGRRNYHIRVNDRTLMLMARLV